MRLQAELAQFGEHLRACTIAVRSRRDRTGKSFQNPAHAASIEKALGQVLAELLALKAAVTSETPLEDAASAAVAKGLETGALVPSALFSEKTGFSKQALSVALKADRLFALEVGNVRVFPAFYLDRVAYDRRKVEAVCRRLAGLSGVAKWAFFSEPREDLLKAGAPRTPLAALQEGDFEAVLQAAAAVNPGEGTRVVRQRR